MIWLSRVVTRPLEDLATGVRAFGVGDSSHLLPSDGTREVRELSLAFARMRDEIMRTNQALARVRAPRHHRPNGKFGFARSASLSCQRLCEFRVPCLITSFRARAKRDSVRYPDGSSWHHRTHRIDADLQPDGRGNTPFSRVGRDFAGTRNDLASCTSRRSGSEP